MRRASCYRTTPGSRSARLSAEEYGFDILVQSLDISKLDVANARKLGVGLGDALLTNLASSAQG